jgi:hypothetical protein
MIYCEATKELSRKRYSIFGLTPDDIIDITNGHPIEIIVPEEGDRDEKCYIFCYGHSIEQIKKELNKVN